MDLKALKPAGGKASPQNSGEQVTQVVTVPDKPATPPHKVATPAPEAVQYTAEQMRQQMAAVAQKLREIAQSNSRDLEFSVDEESHRTVITVRNAATGEVVRQIPGEELLDLQRRLNVGYGTLVDWVV
jgi:flagellar protein FlaG